MKMDLRGIGWDGMNRDQWRALMNLVVPYEIGKFLSG
jgi:hypothetical protein